MAPPIRTPVKGPGAGAGASGPQEPRSTPRSASAGTSGAIAPTRTPSPVLLSGQVPDAARTFIRRPERKRRSMDNMEIFKKQNYTTVPSDQLLQEVMKTFEDIPNKVKEYPQMRRDIKTFLERESDKGLRTLFELSRRMKDLELAPKTAPPATTTMPTPPESSEHLLERLAEVEANIRTQLSDLGNQVKKGFKDMEDYVSDSGADIVDRVFEVGDKVGEVSKTLSHVTDGVTHNSRAVADLEGKLGDVAGGIAASTDSIKEALRQVTSEPKTSSDTYASAAAAKPAHRPALHSMAVTYESGLDTADEVLARVKKAVDARGAGLKINKCRKAKNQTVILGCDTEAELKRVKERIESRGTGLVVATMTNKNPLVVLKDVFVDSEDDEMVQALYTQNESIFRDLNEEERKIEIKYKKRTRNPNTAHVVVQVRPKVWQRMTKAGALYLDMQRVRVEDQSPLIQCTKCLAFGHGRKFCTESVDRCSHCGGPHLREKCAEFVAGSEPQCCNCLHSKLQKTEHNAFSAECPVRKKWDYLARTTTAYA